MLLCAGNVITYEEIPYEYSCTDSLVIELRRFSLSTLVRLRDASMAHTIKYLQKYVHLLSGWTYFSAKTGLFC